MTTPHNTNLIPQLTSLGLTEHDAQVYLAILRVEEATAGTILDATKLHREQVYRSLKRLVDGGYVTEFEQRKRATFAAVNPSVFIKQADAQKNIADSLYPHLVQLHHARSHSIQVTEGVDALKFLMDDIIATLPNGGEYVVIGGSQDLFITYAQEFLPTYQKKFAKLGIKARIIGYNGQELDKESAHSFHTIETRMLPRPITTPSSIVIYGDTVALEVFDPLNIAIITIKNQTIADSYRATFEELWKVGSLHYDY